MHKSIITEDYSLNNMFGNTAEAVNSALVNEAKPVETILPEVKQHIVSEIITEDYLFNKSNETQSLLIPEHSEINKENKVTEEAITTISTTTVNSLVNTFEQDKKEHSFVDFLNKSKKKHYNNNYLNNLMMEKMSYMKCLVLTLLRININA